MKTLLAALALPVLLSSTPALASNWMYVASATDGQEVYADIESIRKVRYRSNTYVTAWIKWDQQYNMSVPESHQLIEFYFDCNSYKSGPMSSVKYRADGSVLDNINFSYLDLSSVTPDSIGYTTLRFVCERAEG